MECEINRTTILIKRNFQQAILEKPSGTYFISRMCVMTSSEQHNVGTIQVFRNLDDFCCVQKLICL